MIYVAGLNLFGQALKDVDDTLIQCEETKIAEKLEKFIEDLIACTECKSLSHYLRMSSVAKLLQQIVSIL